MAAAVVHLTEDLLADFDALYEWLGDSADPIRDALVKAIKRFQRDDLDDALVMPYGLLRTSLSYNFCEGYIVTYTSDTPSRGQDQSMERHYYLKNLIRKK
jgi:hypothetical protein